MTNPTERSAESVSPFATLGLDGVKAEASKRGADQAIIDLKAGAEALRSADVEGAVPAGTPAETQLLDHLDGIIVGLVRRARKAGRSAADRLGDPAIATAFELSKLYGPSGNAKKNAPAAPKGAGNNPAPGNPAESPK